MQPKFILLFLSMLLVVGCKSGGKKSLADFDESNPGPTRIEFLDGTEHNFGTYSDSVTLVHYFRFKVVGDAPLVITQTLPSCGCTDASHSYRPVMPGDIDSICISYNGNGFHPGYFSQSCEIVSNAPSVDLIIEGEFQPRMSN